MEHKEICKAYEIYKDHATPWVKSPILEFDLMEPAMKDAWLAIDKYYAEAFRRFHGDIIATCMKSYAHMKPYLNL